MDFDNKAKDAAIAAERGEKKTFFTTNITTLTPDEKKKFDSLMDGLLEQKWLIRGMHNAAIEELEWDKLPLFLKDKWIQTFKEPNMVKRLLLAARNAISDKLKGKPTGFEVPDGEIIDKD